MDYIQGIYELMEKGLEKASKQYNDSVVTVKIAGRSPRHVSDFTFPAVKLDDFVTWGSYKPHSEVKDQLINLRSLDCDNTRGGKHAMDFGILFLSHRWFKPGQVDDEKNTNYQAALAAIETMKDVNISSGSRTFNKRKFFRYIFVDYSCLPQAEDPLSRLIMYEGLNKINLIQEISRTIVVGTGWEPRGWLIGELMMAFNSRGLEIHGLPMKMRILSYMDDVIDKISRGESALNWHIPILREKDKVIIFYNIIQSIDKLKLHNQFEPKFVASLVRSKGIVYLAIGHPNMEQIWRNQGITNFV